jgi:hypothetical protein
MSPLLVKQLLFGKLVISLLTKALELGYQFKLGDAKRDQRLFGVPGVRKGYGHPRSCHKIQLALDLDLFKDGRYLGESEDHKELGLYWESLHPDCRWGGRFSDGNHYSLTHEGMA